MKLYWGLENGAVALVADAPEGAQFIGNGPMSEKDDWIDEVDWGNKRYRSRKDGWVAFPPVWYKNPNELTWRVHRIGTKIYE